MKTREGQAVYCTVLYGLDVNRSVFVSGAWHWSRDG